MNNITELYFTSLTRAEEQLQFWQNSLQNLKSLDFSMYADKLKVPVLVPIGNTILFRGEFRQTNQVTFRVGNEYLVKCSANQADVVRQHRIKVAQSNVESLLNERELILKQAPFITNTFNEHIPEIFEEVTEEEDLKWREKHRQNVRKYKQSSKTEMPTEKTSDEELWRRLEELELQEELELEVKNLDKPKTSLKKIPCKKSGLKPAPENIQKVKKEEIDKTTVCNHRDAKGDNKKSNTISPDNNDTLNPKPTAKGSTVPKDDKKFDIKEVKDKQNELKDKQNELKVKENELKDKQNGLKDKQNGLKDKQNDIKDKHNELKYRLAAKTKSPAQSIMELLTRLDEMEKLEELEDEMERLDYNLEDEDFEESEDEVETPAGEIKRSVSFADDKNSKTLQLRFRHSRVKPDTTPYDEAKGITKPSDVYAAFSHLCSETKSILKKSKYERDYTPSGPRVGKRTKVADFQEAADNRRKNKTIVLKDVVERVECNDNKFKYQKIVENDDKPLSVFKKRRQQNR